MKTQTNSGGRKTVLFVVLGLVAIVLVLVGVWFVGASRASGYWQIRSAERSFKVPADWQKVSTTSDVGWWGVACGDAFDENGCPFKTANYKVAKEGTTAKDIGALLSSFSNLAFTDESCHLADKSKFSQDPADKMESCLYDSNTSNSKLVISINKKNDNKTYEISVNFRRLTSNL